jgi:hypothetical protein
MMFPTARVQTGMRVVGANGSDIGTVKEVRSNDFLLDRSMQRDLYVPFDAVNSVSDDTVVLNVNSDQVGSLGWPSPPVT